MKTANHYHYLYSTAKRQFGEGRPVSRLGYLPKATLRTVWTQKSTPDSKPPPYQRADNGVKGNLQEAFQKDRKGKGRVLALAIIMAILLLAWEAPVLPEFSSKKKHPWKLRFQTWGACRQSCEKTLRTDLCWSSMGSATVTFTWSLNNLTYESIESFRGVPTEFSILLLMKCGKSWEIRLVFSESILFQEIDSLFFDAKPGYSVRFALCAHFHGAKMRFFL